VIHGLAVALALSTAHTPPALADRRAATPSAPVEIPADGRIVTVLADQRVPTFASPGMPSRLYLSRARARALIGPDADRFEDMAREDADTALMPVLSGGGIRVGAVPVRGRAEQIRTAGGKVALSWFETDAYPGGDALAGPWALVHPVVRFRLRDAAPDDTATSFPLDARNRFWLATTTRAIRHQDILFAFAPQFDRTVASAAAGTDIARAYGGRFDGPVERVHISHGILRPARPMMVDRPILLGPLRIDRLLVRTADYGSVGGIAAPPEAPQTGDVVVKRRRQPARPSYFVYLGRDVLDGCASILFDKPARRIDLSCRPATPRPR
jgi:hypothetical protein